MTALCNMARIRNVSIKIDASAPISLNITEDLMETPLYTMSGGGMGTVGNLFFSRWNAGELPNDPGTYERLEITESPCQVYSMGGFVEARVFATVEVYHSRHLGSFTPEQVAAMQGDGSPDTPMPDVLNDWEELPEDAPAPETDIEITGVARY